MNFIYKYITFIVYAISIYIYIIIWLKKINLYYNLILVIYILYHNIFFYKKFIKFTLFSGQVKS